MSLEATSAQSAPSRTPAVAGNYSIDAAHSRVGFSVRHMMISNVRGEFTKLSGGATYDPSNPEATRVTAEVETGSINTREEQRDTHLRSQDFFDSEHFPVMTFVSKSARKKGDGLELKGELTIRGTTHEVTLNVEDITPERSDPWGKKRLGASARTKIRRSDFGMRWNAALEAGGVLVGDEVTVELEVELVRQ